MSPARGLALALLLATPSAAQEALSVTLEEALQRASERNPSLLAARERAGAANARAEAADRAHWPRLAAQSGWTRTNNPSIVFAQKLNAGQFGQDDFQIDRLNDPDALSHLSTSVALQVPLDLMNKVGARAESAGAAARAGAAQAREAQLELRLHVVRAYRQAALARQALSVTERAAEAARAREQDIAARVEQGAALQADLLRARSRRREREADLAARRGDEELALVGLAQLLDAGADERFVPSETAPPPAPLEGDPSVWLEQAQARPALEAAREAGEAARWSAKAESKALLPDIGVFGELRDDRNTFGDKQTGVVGVGVSWNAFDATRSRREAAVEAERRAAELELRALERRVRLEVATAWSQARTARERHAAAAGGSEEGREALRVMQERRSAGMATLTDELETETAALAAQLQEIQAAAEAAMADAALRRAAGEL